MRHLLSIATLFFLLCVTAIAQAQIEVVYPDEDLVRVQTFSDRPERQASVSAPDTTRLPFFEDFTDPLVPMKEVIDTIGAPVKVITHNLHGLQSGDSILIFDVPVAKHAALNGNFYVKVLDPFTFQLYDDIALGQNDSIGGNDSIILEMKWARLPYVRQSIIISPTPDPLKWISNGGTYINDRYPVEPPSYNVATFDGLKQDGTQYNGVNFNAQGYADQLTSIPIDMSGLIADDSIYLSFYWQAGGIGELPETNDFLVLEAKTNANTWVELWRMNGPTTATVDTSSQHFLEAKIVLTDPLFFYKGFQFRFRNYGRQSGPFDVWNLDKIYLDSGRHLTDTIKDWAISRAQHSFLKNYSAMPYEHFFIDKANQVSAKDSLSIINTSKLVAGYNVLVEMYDITDGIITYLSNSPTINLSFSSSWEYREDADLVLNTTPLVNTNVPRAINLHYYIQNQIDDSVAFVGNNNYYSTQTILWNYYAYDDGTPEYAIKTVSGGVNLANRYQLSTIKDTLTAIDFCFTRNAGINMQGRTIFMTVWSHDATKNIPDTITYQETIDISYSDPFYAMTRYKLSTPVYLNPSDIFYVGYVQNFVDPLFVGYDASVNHADKMYYNDGTGWTRYDTTSGAIKGSLMIRPVFDNGQTLTPVIDPNSNNYSPVLYPNPADDLLYIDGTIAEVQILDLLGRPVLNYTSTQNGNAQHIMNTASLPEGLYLVRMVSPEGAMKTEKLLVK